MNTSLTTFQQSTITNTVPRTYVSHHQQSIVTQFNSSTNKSTNSNSDSNKTPLPAPISEFSLIDMGVDQERLVNDMAPTFDDLALDIYEKKRQEVVLLKKRFPEHTSMLETFVTDYLCSKATLNDVSSLISQLSPRELSEVINVGAVRFRSIAKFDVHFGNSPSPRIQRVAASGFVQQTTEKSDFRSLPRFFHEASDFVTDSVEVRQILRFVALKVKQQHSSPVTAMAITLHQVVVQVDSKTPFHLPDGVHQDGADYIVSAIPILMPGVLPPVSTVYDNQLRPMLETHLGVGQGLLHDDRSYWHSVSALVTASSSEGARGRRGTIGLDVQIAS